MFLKKGFTIIELLAVIVIMGVITAIAVPSISQITKKANDRLYCSKLAIVQKSAERYADDNILVNTCEIDGVEYTCESITVQSLINGNYLDSDDLSGSFLDPRDKTPINTKTVLVYTKSDRNYAYIADVTCQSSLAEVLDSNQLTSVKHSATFILDGGVWAGTSPVTLREGTTLFVNYPTKTNYTFTGWSSDVPSSSVVGTTFTMGTADTVLTANWAINTYTLTVNANGGTWSGTTPQTIAYGNNLTIDYPTKENYTFSGWTVTGTGSSVDGTTFTMGSSNTTLTANWTINTYTLTVNADGGTWSGTTPQTIAYGSTSTIDNPTKSGYAFTGWTVSGTGSTVVGTTFTMGTANTVITANWLLTGYTLTVSANGGTWVGTSPQTLSTGATATIANPTKSGTVFTGWTVSGAGSSITGTTFTMGSANTTLTANWVVYTYTGSSTFIDDGNGNWRIKFLTSGTFTPLVAMNIDIFLVGGGGNGGKGLAYSSAAGGGGGYTATIGNISLAINTAYSITVGAGGLSGVTANRGGTSSAFGYSAGGGYGIADEGRNGGAGGSGGGAGCYGSSYTWGGNGGSNGSAGYTRYSGFVGGSGQGTTTREFGQSDQPLYGGGGGGGSYYKYSNQGIGGATGGGNGGGAWSVGSNGSPNTGGGGGGGAGTDKLGGNGGSGIVVIRNHR